MIVVPLEIKLGYFAKVNIRCRLWSIDDKSIIRSMTGNERVLVLEEEISTTHYLVKVKTENNEIGYINRRCLSKT